MLLSDRVNALAVLALGGFDGEPHLLAHGTGEEAPDRVILPTSQFCEFGEGCAFGPPDQGQDLRALALRAWGGGFLGPGGLGGFGLPLQPALAFAPLAAFWPLGAPFFWWQPFFEEAFSGATCAPCAATVAAVLVSALVMLVLVSFSALRLRMTIHHSGPPERQGNSEILRNDDSTRRTRGDIN